MAIDFSQGGSDKQPLCEFCKTKVAIRVISGNNGYIACCNSCYIEQTQPITKADIKNLIKEVIMEYESKRHD